MPFVASVNIGPTRTGWLATGDRASPTPSTSGRDRGAGYGWKGCVMARAYPWDTDDDRRGEAVHLVLLSTTSTADNNWPTIRRRRRRVEPTQARKGPNLGCGTPITPLTKSKATIKAALAAMKPLRRGGTAGNLGLVWGWRTISPRWRGLWGRRRPAARLQDTAYGEGRGDPDRRQQRLLRSRTTSTRYDPGTTRSDFTAYGRSTRPAPVGLLPARPAPACRSSNTRMAGTCTAMKAREHQDLHDHLRLGDPATRTSTGLRDDAGDVLLRAETTPRSARPSAIGGQLANLRIVE